MPLDRLHSSRRSSLVPGTPADVWARVTAAGGRPRWYVDAAPWVVRGGLDRLIGGDGRRWPVPPGPQLRTGDRAGFWQVLAADDDRHRLVLGADVRAPGGVVLETTVDAHDDRTCRLSQVVTFTPDGLLGRLYLVADLPARATVISICHRSIRAEILR